MNLTILLSSRIICEGFLQFWNCVNLKQFSRLLYLHIFPHIFLYSQLSVKAKKSSVGYVKDIWGNLERYKFTL